MPYDYAREQDEARNAYDRDHDDDEVTAFDLRDEEPDENGEGPQECQHCGAKFEGEHACLLEP